MTKKTTRKTYKSRITRPNRKQKTLNTRSIAVVFGFVLLIGIALYGLNYLKDEVYGKKDVSRDRVLNSKIEKVDRSLYEILFKLGISNNHILKESTYEESKDGLSWNTRKKTFRLNRIYSKDEFTNVFDQLLPVECTISIEYRGGSYFSRINIDGYNTHVFDFVYKKPEKSLVETVLKTGKKDKANDFVLYSGKKPKISIIVDDIGIDKDAVDHLIGISNNFTFAILPNRSFTSYAAERASKNNVDILLHQPMEPKLNSGYTADDAGEGVLMVGQTKESIVKTLNNNLLSLPNVVGVNNHMGSKFTENEELMLLILGSLKQKDLFFVDSLTSSNSKGYIIAKELGMKAAKRDVFLDDEKKDKSYVKKQLRKLVSKARKRGYAVGICHTYPQTIKALREEIPNISKEVDITPINKLYN